MRLERQLALKLYAGAEQVIRWPPDSEFHFSQIRTRTSMLNAENKCNNHKLKSK